PRQHPGAGSPDWRTSGEADVSGPAHRGQRRAGRAVRGAAGGPGPARRGRADRRTGLPLARGPDRQARLRRTGQILRASGSPRRTTRHRADAATAHARRREGERGRGDGQPARRLRTPACRGTRRAAGLRPTGHAPARQTLSQAVQKRHSRTVPWGHPKPHRGGATMTITTTRGRPGGAKPADTRQTDARQARRAGARPVDAGRRGAGRPGREAGGLIVGADALQVGYAAPQRSARTATRPAPRVQPVRGPVEAAPVSPPVGMSLTDAVPAPVALPRAPFLVSVVAVVVIGAVGVLPLNTRRAESAVRPRAL